MTTKYWQPKAVAIEQESSVQITANDVTTTYILTVNGIDVSVPGNAGGVNDTASDLADAWNASTYPYFSEITALASTDTVTLTADVAGLPFTVTSSVSGGTGTIGAVSDDTAATGPNSWDNADNWSGGVVPVNSDDVIIANTDVPITHGLDQSAVTLATLRVDRSFTGHIGLDYAAVATSADGLTTDNGVPEYRDTYLHIKSAAVNIGQNYGQDIPAGSGRIMLNLDSTACQVTIHDTAAASSDQGRPSIRLKANSASTDIFVRKASGGFGIAVDEPGETSTIGDLTITDITASTRVQVGAGVTLTNYLQSGGQNIVQAAATITLLEITGGTLTTEGDYTITTCNVKGGTLNSNHVKTAGNCITTLNLTGGTITTQGNGEARTINSLVLGTGGALRSDGGVVAVTGITEPTGRYTLSMGTQS